MTLSMHTIRPSTLKAITDPEPKLTYMLTSSSGRSTNIPTYRSADIGALLPSHFRDQNSRQLSKLSVNATTPHQTDTAALTISADRISSAASVVDVTTWARTELPHRDTSRRERWALAPRTMAPHDTKEVLNTLATLSAH
jgi:hypothetical protein